MKTKTELRESRAFVRILGGLIALGPLSIDLYLPSMTGMADHFGSDIVHVSLTMTTYLIGSAVGQFFGGTLSDQLGRKRVALIGLFTFILSSLMILMAPSIEAVQLLRALQGLGGGCSSVICLAIVRDVYPVEEVPKRYASAAMIMLLAPLIAPLLGAFLSGFGWQFIFGFLATYALIFFFIYLSRIPETRESSGAAFSWREFFMSYGEVLRHRVDGHLVASRFLAFNTVNSGVFMCYLTNAAAIFMQHFGLTTYQFAILFGGNALMMMVGNRVAYRMVGKYPPQRIIRIANFIQTLTLGAIILSIVTGFENLWIIMALMLATIACSGTIYPTTSGAFISLFEKNSGCASSLNFTIINLCGSLIGALGGIVAQGRIMPVFAVMLGCVLVAQFILRGIHTPAKSAKTSTQ